MIVDCFPFFNELDLLEIRLNTLNDVVDRFVIVEAAKTQSLKDKPFYFDLHKNEPRFAKFKDKIIHVQMTEESCPKNDTNLWNMEHAQRNTIKDAILLMGQLPLDSIIMVSDCDEIPNPDAIRALRDMEDWHIVAFDMSFHAYFVNLSGKNKRWVGTVAARLETFQHVFPQDMRDLKDRIPRISNGGWHLSWLGGYDKVYEKFVSCIEPFDKNTVPSLEEVKTIFDRRVLKEKQFHLIDISDDSVELELIEEDAIPPYASQHKTRFKNLFLS